MTDEELINTFKLHDTKKYQIGDFEHIRLSGRNFADVVNLSVMDCREKSLAITKIEEAVFWANAAVARHPNEFIQDPPEVQP